MSKCEGQKIISVNLVPNLFQIQILHKITIWRTQIQIMMNFLKVAKKVVMKLMKMIKISILIQI